MSSEVQPVGLRCSPEQSPKAECAGSGPAVGHRGCTMGQEGGQGAKPAGLPWYRSEVNVRAQGYL